MILPDAGLLVLAFWLGAALALLYAAERVLCLVLSLGKYTVFIFDVLFCVLCGACTFLLALAGTNGQPRLYWLVFEAGGFYCMHITLGRLIVLGVKKLLTAFRPLRGKIDRENGKSKEKRRLTHAKFRKSAEKNRKRT